MVRLRGWRRDADYPPTHAALVALPPLCWALLLALLVSYVLLTQVIKTWFIRRFGDLRCWASL